MSNLTLKAIFYKYYNTLVTKSTIVQLIKIGVILESYTIILNNS